MLVTVMYSPTSHCVHLPQPPPPDFEIVATKLFLRHGQVGQLLHSTLRRSEMRVDVFADSVESVSGVVRKQTNPAHDFRVESARGREQKQ